MGEIVERLPREVELTLFRALQETLTRVHRHANARPVDVRSRAQGNAILIVRDDGKGIAGDALARFRAGLAGGIGLAGMQESWPSSAAPSMRNPAKVDP